MKIIVCVKQVPGSTAVEVDPVTGVLKRDGVAAKLNPYDLFSLETAFRLKETCGGEITVLTMGPDQAKEALKETLWMGADQGILLSDRKFAGADVSATSYTLMQGVRAAGSFDLILCGKQTTDGDTAQVGPELAERLGIDHASNVTAITEITEDSITVTMDLDSMIQTQKMQLPCLLTMDKDINTPRLPSYKRKIMTRDDQIRSISAADMNGADENRLGLKGSPTQVERIFPPEKNTDHVWFEGSDTEKSEQLYQLLKSRKFI